MNVRSVRPLPLLLLLGLLAAAACAKNGVAPGVVQPAVPTNERLLLRGTVPCLDATVARVDQLHAAGAPFGGPELRTMLFARLALPERALQLLDTSKPIGFALVDRPGLPPAAATAMVPRGTDPALFAAAFGTKVS